MSIEVGSLSFSRPSSPISHSDVEYLIAIAGKDLVRIAWHSLAPYKCGHFDSNKLCNRGPFNEKYCTKLIRRENLVQFFCSFFNLKRGCGQGSACVDQLVNNGVLISHCCVFEFDWCDRPRRYYAEQCGPDFII